MKRKSPVSSISPNEITSSNNSFNALDILVRGAIRATPPIATPKIAAAPAAIARFSNQPKQNTVKLIQNVTKPTKTELYQRLEKKLTSRDMAVKGSNGKVFSGTFVEKQTVQSNYKAVPKILPQNSMGNSVNVNDLKGNQSNQISKETESKILNGNSVKQDAISTSSNDTVKINLSTADAESEHKMEEIISIPETNCRNTREAINSVEVLTKTTTESNLRQLANSAGYFDVSLTSALDNLVSYLSSSKGEILNFDCLANSKSADEFCNESDSESVGTASSCLPAINLQFTKLVGIPLKSRQMIIDKITLACNDKWKNNFSPDDVERFSVTINQLDENLCTHHASSFENYQGLVAPIFGHLKECDSIDEFLLQINRELLNLNDTSVKKIETPPRPVKKMKESLEKKPVLLNINEPTLEDFVQQDTVQVVSSDMVNDNLVSWFQSTFPAAHSLLIRYIDALIQEDAIKGDSHDNVDKIKLNSEVKVIEDCLNFENEEDIILHLISKKKDIKIIYNPI